MRIGIIGRTDRKKVFEITHRLVAWLKERGVLTLVETSLAAHIGHSSPVEAAQLPERVDLILVFGGDGTFLSVARLVSSYDIPILGINLGALGFLTEITVSELYPMMERILARNYETEQRQMLSATIRGESELENNHLIALNDVVVNKGTVARMIDLAVYIGGSHVTNFRADGIILSTPTGSTAYSLSAGGPIVYPTLPLIVMTPICPHTLTNRPLVVSSETEIKIKILTDSPDVYLTLDGQRGVNLQVGDFVEVKKADRCVMLIRSPYRDYFTILKNKLMWAERYGYAPVEE
ncbi:MAG: NAD(+)/NADH kinase [Deltaproteobacteria bacterium]